MEVLVKRFILASALFVLSVPSVFTAQNPWVGTWKPDYAKSNHIEVTGPLVISTPSPGIMRREYPTIETTLEGKPDGSAMNIHSPRLPKGIVETVKLLTPTKLTYSIFVNGKPLLPGRGNTVLMDSKKRICCGLKMPRCGLMRGIRCP